MIRDSLATFTTAEKAVDDVASQIVAMPHRWCVVEGEGKVVGFANYFQFRGGPGYAHSMEYSIHLAPNARRTGMGKMLLAQVEADAREEGAHSLYGGVSGANLGGEAFHSRMGFQKLATLPEVGRKHGEWIDLHLYQKFL